MSQVKQLTLLLLAIAATLLPIECSQSRKLDEGVPPPPASQISCTMCTNCDNPCNQRPPPPPPSPPLPPKKPSKPYCPPPPPPPYYIVNQPGVLYPIDNRFPFGACSKFGISMPIFIACGFLSFLAVWRL